MVVIVAPNAPKTVVDATVQSLAEAGATVTGVIDVRPTFVDPSQVANLGQLATSWVRPLRARTLPAQASALLAERARRATCRELDVVARGTLDAASTETLAVWHRADSIVVAQAPTQHARLAVIVAPTPAAPPSSPAATASRNALVSLVAAFPGAGGTTVVAGASGSAAGGGLLAALRVGGTSGAGTAAVSTVDDADGPAGSVAVIMALQAELGPPRQRGGGGSITATVPARGPCCPPATRVSCYPESPWAVHLPETTGVMNWQRRSRPGMCSSPGASPRRWARASRHRASATC